MKSLPANNYQEFKLGTRLLQMRVSWVALVFVFPCHTYTLAHSCDLLEATNLSWKNYSPGPPLAPLLSRFRLGGLDAPIPRSPYH